MSLFRDFISKTDSSGSAENANNDLIFAVDDQPEVLSLKFFLLVSAEESKEKEELKSIHEMIRDYYTACPKENAESLAGFSAALVDHIAKAENKDQEWTSIYKTFYEQIERLDNEQQKKFIIEVAPVTFVLKATPDAEKVYETYVYRMSGYESCLKLSKEEIISLLEDTREFYDNAMAEPDIEDEGSKTNTDPPVLETTNGTDEEQPFNFEGIDDNFPDSSDHADNDGVSASDESRLAFLDLGVMFREKKNYKKALYYYKQCIEENLSEHGIYHEQLAVAYNDIGLIYNEKGLDEEALELYKKVLRIGLKVHGEKHENVVIYYANLGEWYFEHKGYKEALHFHEKSMGVKLAIYPNDHQEVGFSFDKIGLCWQLMGNHSKALEFHRKCLEINIKHNGTSHEYVAIGQFNIGECLMDSGQYKEATESLKKAYAIEKLGGYAFKIAECYEALQDRDNALDYYIKSAEVRKDSLGQDHEKTVKAVDKAKEINDELGQFDFDLPAWFDDAGEDFDFDV